MMKRIALCLCLLLIAYLNIALAEPAKISGEVAAGSTDNSLTIRVNNSTKTAATNVRVKVLELPDGLLNFRVEPAVVKNIPAAGSAVYRVLFDVAEDAEVVDSVEIVFALSAIKVKFATPNPKLAVAIIEAAEEETPPIRRETCGSEVRQGGNTPETIIIDTGDYQGNALFSWEMFEIKDQMRVYLGDRLVHDTGCVDQTGKIEIPVRTNGQDVKVAVLPNCAKPSTTEWSFRVDCRGDDPVATQNNILKLVKIEGPTAKNDPDAVVRYVEGEPGCSEHIISRADPNGPSGFEYLGSLKIVNPPLELTLGEPFQLELDAKYMYKRRILDCPVGYQSFGPPSIRVAGMGDMKGKEIRQSCPKQSDQESQLQASQSLHNILRFTPVSSAGQGDSLIYRYKAETTSTGSGKIENYYEISSQGIVFVVGLRPDNNAYMADGKISLQYAPVAATDSPAITQVPPYRHPVFDQTAADENTVAETGDAAKRTGSNQAQTSVAGPVAASIPLPAAAVSGLAGGGGNRAGSGAGVSSDKMDPTNPSVSGLIKEWLSNAQPVANARGADLRFDKWGRVEGRAVGGIITLHGKPDNVAGQTPEQYVWNQRNTLDSLNLCTLGEFVERSLRNASLAFCRNRYQPEPQTALVSLPDVVGMTYRKAVAALTAAGLIALPPELGSDAPSPTFVGRVESAIPAVAGQLHRGDKVGLRLFGEASSAVPVPNLVGLGIREAARQLEAAGFTPAFELGEDAPRREMSGQVYRQSPAPGQEIAENAEVTAQVYGEYSPAPAPVAAAKNNCSGSLEWDDELGRCVDNSPAAQVARHDCTAYPGAFPKWDTALQQPQCICLSGWKWSTGEQRCVDDSPRAKVARADCSHIGRYGEAYWNSKRQEARCRCFDGYYLNADNVCVREQVAQRRPPPPPAPVDDTDWQQVADDLTTIIGTLAGVNSKQPSVPTPRQQPRSQSHNQLWPKKSCASDIRVNGSYVDCNCPGWGFDPKSSQCRQGFSDRYSSKPKKKSGQVYAGFGPGPGSGSGGLHPCQDTNARVNATVLKYARIYGGGGTSYKLKGDLVCYANSYDKISSGSVDYYKCQQKDFGSCYQEKSRKIDRRDQLENGKYTLVFDGGNSWWTFYPK